MFQTGDCVVYPAQGVGKIEDINHQDIGGASCHFYVVRIVSNDVRLMVPVHNASNVGLRLLGDASIAQEILEYLGDGTPTPVHVGQNWNRRFREYTEKLKSVALKDVAMVVRELLLISRSKELSFGERRLLEQAMGLVFGELAEILQKPEAALRQDIVDVYTPLPPPEVPPPTYTGKIFS